MTNPSQGDVTPQGANPDADIAAQNFQQEWQKRVESLKEEAKRESEEQILSALAQSLGVKKEEAKGGLLVAVMEKIKSNEEDRLKDKEDANRSRWERDHPEVFQGENAKRWEEANKNPKYATLDYDERYALAGIKAKSSSSSSQPMFSKGAPPSEEGFGSLPPDIKKWFESKGVKTEEHWKSIGK